MFLPILCANFQQKIKIHDLLQVFDLYVELNSQNCIQTFFGRTIFLKLCVTEPDFLKKIFDSRIGKMGPKMDQKQGILNFLKNLVILLIMCFVIKIYIICCVRAQIPSLRKFLFLTYGPNYSQLIRLQDFLINHISRANQ